MADGQLRANFGATPFARTPPVGFAGFDAALEIAIIPASIEVVGASLTVEGSSSGPTLGWSTTFKTSTVTLSDSNLRAHATTRGSGRTETLITGKKYWEITIVSRPAVYSAAVGWVNSGQPFNNSDDWVGRYTAGVGFYSNGEVWYNSNIVDTASAFTTGDTVSFAVDGSTYWFRNNGGDWNQDPSANPATGVGGNFQGEGDIYPAYDIANEGIGGEILANFGASEFLRTPPSGFSGFDEPSSAEITIHSGEVEITGARLGVEGSPEEPVDFVPGFIEIVGSVLEVAGSGEIEVVFSAIDVVGAVLLINDLAAATAINVLAGRVNVRGATLVIETNDIDVVPGETNIVGAILLIETNVVAVVPGELNVVGATLTVVGEVIVHIVPGEIEIRGATASISGVALGEMQLVGMPVTGPLLTANIIIGA